MELQYVKLSDKEIASELAHFKKWDLKDGKLYRQLRFETYSDGALFGAAVAVVADQLNHHPDIKIGYQQVEISVSTHDVGGLSSYDFELARRIDRLLS